MGAPEGPNVEEKGALQSGGIEKVAPLSRDKYRSVSQHLKLQRALPHPRSPLFGWRCRNQVPKVQIVQKCRLLARRFLHQEGVRGSIRYATVQQLPNVITYLGISCFI